MEEIMEMKRQVHNEKPQPIYFQFTNSGTWSCLSSTHVSEIITPLSCQTEISISLNYLQEGRLQGELCQRIRNVFRLRDPVEKLNRSAEKRQGRQTKL